MALVYRTFTLFDRPDKSFMQFGAGPAINANMNSNLLLTVKKNRNSGKVSSGDYLFRVAANSKSEEAGINRSNGILSVSVKLSYGDNTSELKNLMYKNPNLTGRANISDLSMLSGESNFSIPNYNNKIRISLHHLTWLYKDGGYSHLGKKLGGVVPAGIDPLLGGSVFGGRTTLFGE
tara:strand:- start:620 stop:1150 length:531 start_codon:yes stop_codon:yes gene_type:complete